MKSKMCEGCPKVMVRDDGVKACWYDGSPIGFWSDLLMGFECPRYEHYKKQMKQRTT